MRKELGGFNPISKENNFGSGMACGLLIAVDLPFAVVSFIWNKLNKKIEFRSVGLMSVKDVLKTDDKNIGFYLGTLLFGCGVFSWTHPNKFLILLSVITAIINIRATIKYNKKETVTG